VGVAGCVEVDVVGVGEEMLAGIAVEGVTTVTDVAKKPRPATQSVSIARAIPRTIHQRLIRRLVAVA
jgi:hypothetical protein